MSETFAVPRSAESVWDELVVDHPMGFLSALVLNERFIVWEEGRRMAFGVETSNLPVFRRFGEDYRIEPTSTEACTLTWTIATDPQPYLKPFRKPMVRASERSMFGDARKHFSAR
jgi:hypothetical protein